MSLIPLSLLMAEMTTSPENPAIATRALTRITLGAERGSQETEEVTNDGSTDYTAQKSFPRFVRTYFREYLMSSEKFAPDKLHNIVDFRKEYKE